MQQLLTIGLILFWSIACCHASAPAAQPLEYAQNFEIIAQPDYKLVTVKNLFRNSKRSHRYALVPRDAPLPKQLPKDALVIRTPVRRVVVMETVYIGYLAALEQLDSIVGAATVDYISEPSIRERTRSGAIKTIQIGQSLNIESLILLQPDLILTSISGDSTFDVPPKLIRSGLPIVITASYMERHPLARAEWIKFLAPFFEVPEKADEVFQKSAQRYEALLAKTQTVKARPSVFSSAPYSGTWHVAGGDSFTARAIQDAGGHYLWSDNTSQGGIPLDTERVFLKAAEADYWIDPSHYRSLGELFAADPRFAKFRATQIGQVYNNTRQVGDNGGNNIWERGIVHPEEVLADLIKIFHPDLLPEHELIYYENLK
ncbi:MAG TPA: ABC transporter substrate-binding protein [Opitutae bacterium]|nr:ABC transporter substrate-binding protein [Puniceicoccaceae bacterium]HBR92648.1 ABC transporter substrate-binding protein [Opitutae bacterium]|tara:strand:- start:5890 stop:7008 length:1119 start_codon:yes stop_codon:yes gene_type:complete